VFHGATTEDAASCWKSDQISLIRASTMPAIREIRVTFGKDGKPFYVSGPYDTPARVRTIGQTLEKSRGTGNWDYMVEVPGCRISVAQ
jgi:hypothetical protein